MTVLEHRILIEEFYHFEKMKNDFLIFIIKFFDNTKTNIYNKIIDEYKKQTGDEFFDFFFKTVNTFSYLFEFSKTKKNLLSFIKVLLESTNEDIIKKFIAYFKKNIFLFAKDTETAIKKLTSRGIK